MSDSNDRNLVRIRRGDILVVEADIGNEAITNHLIDWFRETGIYVLVIDPGSAIEFDSWSVDRMVALQESLDRVLRASGHRTQPEPPAASSTAAGDEPGAFLTWDRPISHRQDAENKGD